MTEKRGFRIEDVDRVVRFGKALDHPRRVELLMHYKERGPCSATMLSKAGVGALGDVVYHQKRLLESEALVEVDSRQGKGSKERLYVLSRFGIEMLMTAAVLGRARQ